MKVLAITQARYGSTRLPAKILKEVNGQTLLEIHLKRILQAKTINKVKIATTDEEGSKFIVAVADKVGVEYHKGSVDDVLSRFYGTAEPEKPDYVIRLTSDCPLIDPNIIDAVVTFAIEHPEYDYVHTDAKSFPDGLDTEVMKFSAIEKAYKEANLKSEREHVTPYIWKNGTANGGTLFNTYNFPNPAGDFNADDYRITIDEPEDFEVIRTLIENLGIEKGWKSYIDYLLEHKEVYAINSKFSNNEGYANSIANDSVINNIGKGQELYKKAKTMIPGGTSLLSKRPEQLLPENWPAYYSKSKGCKVWDLDGREYIDCGLMGVGTNTLGYAREEVDEAVMKVVRDGNLTTFNCPEEVYLAERLIAMNPWAGGVRYTRGGGEANSMCVRIARAYTGKDKVAICGYHGWHDWYVSVNLADDKALDGHLLPGIPSAGVPSGLRGTSIPFHYNDFEEIENIIRNTPDLAAVKMEVCRNFGPAEGYLEHIRNLCNEYGVILIFDECTSGFRETFGGLHKKYGVYPDMTIYSKTMGNGYVIAAVLGKKEIMDAAQGSWISSTFWTDRIGPTAALAALDVMEKEQSWEKITAIGLDNKKRWQELADKYGLKINQWGIPALAGYTFDSPNALAYKTYVTQEMLKKGYIAGTLMYASLAHTPEILEGYFQALDPIFADIRDFEDGKDVMKALEGPVCQAGFKRLN